MNQGKSFMPLTDSCQISVGSLTDEGRCLVVEVKQRRVGDDKVTTLLLSPDQAHELIEVLSQHAGGTNGRS